MRNRMIAGNWKMNKTYTEGVALMQDLASELKDGTGDVDVVVCPPTVDLRASPPSSTRSPLPSPSAPRTSTGRSLAPSPARPLPTC